MPDDKKLFCIWFSFDVTKIVNVTHGIESSRRSGFMCGCLPLSICSLYFRFSAKS